MSNNQYKINLIDDEIEKIVINMTKTETIKFIYEYRLHNKIINSLFNEQNHNINLEEEIIKDDISNKIKSAINNLDKKYSTIIDLFFFRDIKTNEIATQLGITQKEVNDLKSVAIKKLRPIFEKMELNN